MLTQAYRTRVKSQASASETFECEVLHLAPDYAVMVVYSPRAWLTTSEVLPSVEITHGDEIPFSGPGTVDAVIQVPDRQICRVSLDPSGWRDLWSRGGGSLNCDVKARLRASHQQWEEALQVRQDYKVLVSDFATFLSNLREQLWKLEFESAIDQQGRAGVISEESVEEVCTYAAPHVDSLFERIGDVAGQLPEHSVAVHYMHIRRVIHPYTLVAPFVYRSYMKPLGYAGDYELVNMIARNGHEGPTLYAKVVNACFLRQAPAQAHRNRLAYLKELLKREAVRVAGYGRPLRVLNIGCGPAIELQRFLEGNVLSNNLDATLVDFNEDTLRYAAQVLDEAKVRNGRSTVLKFLKRSVHQLLLDRSRNRPGRPEGDFDLVYCAGLFDYLSDNVCTQLLELMSSLLAPGGMMVATNVEPSNSLRLVTEHILDWHLIARTSCDLKALLPARSRNLDVCVRVEDEGVNVILEARNPSDVSAS